MDGNNRLNDIEARRSYWYARIGSEFHEASEDIRYLLDRVRAVEEQNARMKAAAYDFLMSKLHADVARYREALEWYRQIVRRLGGAVSGDEKSLDLLYDDLGDRARKALGRE